MITTPSFKFVEKQIRKKSFGILSTVSPQGRAHSTGILYGVSLPTKKFRFYLITHKNYKKVRNIRKNPHISFVIPFPHHYLRFVPSSCIYFQGTAELVEFDNLELKKAYSQKRILRSMLKDVDQPNYEGLLTFIEIKPNEKIFCHGLGINLWQLKNHPEKGEYSVFIPKDRM